MKVLSYRDLRVWQKAMDMNEACHAVIILLSRNERFDVGGQLRRSGISVAANIAEGFGQITTKAFLHYLSIAQGSINETETYLEIIKRLGLVTGSSVDETLKISNDTGMLLMALRKSLRNRMKQQRLPRNLPNP